MSLGGFLSQLAPGALAEVEKHFDQVATQAAPADLAQGLASAFRSDATPAFGAMVGQLFARSDASQQAGLLNHLLQALGPAALSGVAGGALAKVLQPGAAQVTPSAASQLTPEQVQEIAAQAEQVHPGIVEHVSDFYAAHPTLVKTLGGAALAIALAKVKDAMTNR